MSPLSRTIYFVGLLCAIYANPSDDDFSIPPKFARGPYKIKPTTKSGSLLSRWNPSMLMKPEEMGEYFEGDIMLPYMSRTGVVAPASSWANGIVPVAYAGNFTVRQMNLIIRAMNEIQTKTCIRFVPRFYETDFIRITSAPTGCWSYVGRIGGQQNLNLQAPGCVTVIGTPIHEFMHALGVMHEQSSPDRDDFVTIYFQNVRPGAEGNFNKYTTAQVSQFSQRYDYGSVMHYSSHAFSKNGLPTIVPKQPGVRIGQTAGMSASDVASLKAMYRCP